jgi:hypothetical protein
MEVINIEVVRSVWGCVYVDWIYLGARGVSGGILVFYWLFFPQEEHLQKPLRMVFFVWTTCMENFDLG